MRATVLESFEGRSVVLAEDGLFYSIEGSYRTGEMIEYAESTDAGRYALRRKALLQKAAAAAACLVLLLSGAVYSYQNLMVYADVTLGGAMPVKCSLNRKNEVIRIEAVSEAGDDLAEDMNENGLKGRNIETVIEYAEKYIETHADDTADHKTTITVECRNETEKKRMEESLNQKYGGDDESGREKASGRDSGENSSGKETLNGPAGNNAGTGGSMDKSEKDPAEEEPPERGKNVGTDNVIDPDPPENGGAQNDEPHGDQPKDDK